MYLFFIMSTLFLIECVASVACACTAHWEIFMLNILVWFCCWSFKDDSYMYMYEFIIMHRICHLVQLRKYFDGEYFLSLLFISFTCMCVVMCGHVCSNYTYTCVCTWITFSHCLINLVFLGTCCNEPWRSMSCSSLQWWQLQWWSSGTRLHLQCSAWLPRGNMLTW